LTAQAEAATIGHAHVDEAEPALDVSWGKLMMWLFLCSDAMSFAGLLAAYAAVRSSAPWWPNPADLGVVPLTALNTFILICSSVTMVKALSAIRRGDVSLGRKWLAATAAGGMIFLGIQAIEWNGLMNHHGVGLSQEVMFKAGDKTIPVPGLFGATFFMTTGFHGCHVFGGVVILWITWFAARKWKAGDAAAAKHYNTVECVGLYWHFVDLIWILVFTLVYLIPTPEALPT
jgi:heme/copper-type cytochrome/quinol oxidase subunit 3